MEFHCGDELNNNTVLRSLSAIKAANMQFHLLAAGNPTPTALVTQIRLCDILLGEIRMIGASLAMRVRCRSQVSQHSIFVRRHRGSRYIGVSQGGKGRNRLGRLG